MTRDEAVATIRNRLGNRGPAFDPMIVDELKRAQDHFEQNGTPPWFLVKTDSSRSTTAGERRLTLPGDWIMESEDDGIWLLAPGGVRLAKREYRALRGSAFYTANGRPEMYAIVGTTMYLFPTPDKEYGLELNYYAADAKLDSGDVENGWLKYAPWLLIAKAGLEVARTLRDEAAVAIFSNRLAEAKLDLLRQTEARRQEGLEAFMGG
jgi:hypothetical protein